MVKLDQRGEVADALLAQCGLSRPQLADPYAQISLRSYVEVLEQAARSLDDQWLGLHLGQNVRWRDLGPLGLFFDAAPTVRLALERMSRFLSALQSHTLMGLFETGEETISTYQIEDPLIWPRIQDSELTLAGLCQLMRSFLGRGWSPLEVHFEHDRPGDRSALQRHFRAPLLFSQPANRIVISTADANRRIRNEDLDLSLVLQRHIADLLTAGESEAEILPRVRRLVSLYVGQDRVTIDRLARELRISRRTLQRELARHNTSIRLLLREHRRAVAEARFASDPCHFGDLAQSLGYADATTFWRAFKSWTGETPRSARNHNIVVSQASDRITPPKKSR